MKWQSRLFVIIFLVVIIYPIMYLFIVKVCGVSFNEKLLGNFLRVEKPKYNFEKLMNGVYQAEVYKYFKEKFYGRVLLIKSYNELRYSVFDVSNRIVGKDGYIFEYDYLNDALLLEDDINYSNEINRNKILDYINSLQNIDSKLRFLNKKLIVYSTPSKAIFHYDKIPDRYVAEQKSGIRAIDVFNKYIIKTDIIYINGTEEIKKHFKSDEIPVFYSTGIHWSRPVEQYLSRMIVNNIQHSYDENIKSFQLKDLELSKAAYWRDGDVYDLMNIFSKYENDYFQYYTEQMIPEKYNDVRVLVQGDSFSEGFVKDFQNNCIGTGIYNIFYDEWYKDEFNKLTVFKQWQQLPLQYLLDRTDVVVIEFNEAILQKLSNGFVNHLEKFLKTYKPGKKEVCFLNRFDKNNKIPALGVYHNEGDFSWGNKFISLPLKNNVISSNGLMLEFTIPGYLQEVTNKQGVVFVYINGKRKRSIPVSEGGRHKIIIKDDLQVNENDEYIVELYSPKSFVPSELGINQDGRSLAIQLHYVGEVY